MGSGLFSSALDLAARGFAVAPLRPQGRTPLVPIDAATTDAASIDRWWRRWPEANIAIALRRSHLVAIMIRQSRRTGNRGDSDPDEWRRSILEEGGLTVTIASPRQVILLFRSGSERLHNARLSPLVQLRVERFVLAPPSVLDTVATYYWDCSPNRCELLPLPAALSDLLIKQRP